MSRNIEDFIPVVKFDGLNTAKDVAFSGAFKTTGTNLKKSTAVTIDAQNGTPTIAQLLTGLILHNSKTGAGTLTFPTGTAMSAGVSGVAVGDTFDVLYNNYGNQTVTITGATGSTVTGGTAAVTTGLNTLIRCVNTGTNTWALYLVT